MEKNDLALEALIASVSNGEAYIELAKKVYAIEKNYQFSTDRAEPIKELQRLIETEIELKE